MDRKTGFYSPIVLRLNRAGFSSTLWIVEQDLLFWSNELQKEFIIPGGFDIDGASIPILLQSLAKRDGQIFEASIIHDYLYANGKKLNIARKVADEIFLNTMKIYNVGKIKMTIAYLTVRLFGKFI